MTKKRKYMLILILLGVLSSVAVAWNEKRESRIGEGGRLLRNEWGTGDYALKLKAEFADEGLKEETVEVLVKERTYTAKETELLAAHAMEELPTAICNGNADLEHVQTDLSLPYTLDGYPFHLRWSVSDEALMDRTGRLLCDPLRTEIYDLTLSCALSYGESSFLWEAPVRIVPAELTRNEAASIALDEMLDRTLAETETEQTVVLPDRIGDIGITWSGIRENNGLIPLAAGFAGALAIGTALDYDERRKKEKEAERLNALYAPFTEKLKLYLMSGLTMKNAFFAIRKDYERAGGKYDILCERMKTACNQFRNNVREELVYEEWGDRCMGSYKRLSFLLTVNLKQGNEKLLSLLDEEVRTALSEERERAKKKGDEAGVKLIFPMILMLIVVMLLIMLPAYIDFS